MKLLYGFLFVVKIIPNEYLVYWPFILPTPCTLFSHHSIHLHSIILLHPFSFILYSYFFTHLRSEVSSLFLSFLFLLLRFCSISSSLLYFLLFCFSLFYNYRIDRVASSDKNRNRGIEITSLFSSSIFDVLLIQFLSSTDVINLPQFEEVITKAITKTKTKTADCRPPLPFAHPLNFFTSLRNFILFYKINSMKTMPSGRKAAKIRKWTENKTFSVFSVTTTFFPMFVYLFILLLLAKVWEIVHYYSLIVNIS